MNGVFGLDNTPVGMGRSAWAGESGFRRREFRPEVVGMETGQGSPTPPQPGPWSIRWGLAWNVEKTEDVPRNGSTGNGHGPGTNESETSEPQTTTLRNLTAWELWLQTPRGRYVIPPLDRAHVR